MDFELSEEQRAIAETTRRFVEKEMPRQQVLKWVRDNEPEIYARIHKALLPGDYLAFRLTGGLQTTVPGLSEGVFWDFKRQGPDPGAHARPARAVPDRLRRLATPAAARAPANRNAAGLKRKNHRTASAHRFLIRYPTHPTHQFPLHPHG